MKYRIFGFRQKEAMELGLTTDDLLLLRWFVDFKECGKMDKKYMKNINDMGYWVSYSKVIEELPILFNGSSVRADKTKLARMLNGNLSKVLTRKFEAAQPTEYIDGKPVHRGGKMYIAIISEVYDLLLNGYTQSNAEGTAHCCVDPINNVVYSDTSTIDTSTIDTSTKEKKSIKENVDIEENNLSCSVLSNLDLVDKNIKDLLLQDPKLKTIDFSKDIYYSLLLESIILTRIQDEVDVLGFKQWNYLKNTLLNKLKLIKSESDLDNIYLGGNYE